jgi:hypothetical protein
MKTRRGIAHIVAPLIIAIALLGIYLVWFTYTGNQLEVHTNVTSKVTSIQQTDTTTIVDIGSSTFTFLGTNLGFQLNHSYTIECVSTTLDRYNPFTYSVVWRIETITEVP